MTNTNKEYESGFRQVRLRKSIYRELISLGIIPESIDSIVRRSLQISKPKMRETQAKVYQGLAAEVTA
jgi:hypothetical protein